jgi:formamidopyrimidine-DNA glycosylase
MSGKRTLRVHLRMTGNLYVIPDQRFLTASIRMVLALADDRAIVFDDMRALGRVSLHGDDELPELLAEIGPEPLSPEFTAEAFAERARKSRKPAKLFLMDQSAIAGLGNIYAAEALFEARIDPRKAMNRISAARLRRLYEAIIRVLRIAVDSSVEAYSRPGGFGEGENYPVAVYGREVERCLRCGKKIRRIPQGGRSTFYCPGCQR